MKYSLRSLMTFSIRDLALVTVIVAILLTWWIDHRAQVSSRENSERGFHALGLRLVKDGYRISSGGEQGIPIVFGPGELPKPSASPPIPPKP